MKTLEFTKLSNIQAAAVVAELIMTSGVLNYFGNSSTKLIRAPQPSGPLSGLSA